MSWFSEESYLFILINPELPSMGSHRVGHDWSNSAAAAAATAAATVAAARVFKQNAYLELIPFLYLLFTSDQQTTTCQVYKLRINAHIRIPCYGKIFFICWRTHPLSLLTSPFLLHTFFLPVSSCTFPSALFSFSTYHSIFLLLLSSFNAYKS